MRAGITEKRLAKNAFYPKKHPKFVKRLISILDKGYFFLLTTFSGRGRNMIRGKKCVFFFGPKSRFWPKNPIFAMRPQFWSTVRLALGETVHFPPWAQFFNFIFLSYGHFCKKWALSASNSLSALSAQAHWAHALRARAG